MRNRPRRLRKNKKIRDAVQQVHVNVGQLVYPIFISDVAGEKSAIESLPGQFRWGFDRVEEIISQAADAKLFGIALFPAINENLKNSTGSESINSEGLVPSCIRHIKSLNFDLEIIADVALDPYSSDGHDGLLVDGEIENDSTVKTLCEMAVLQARAGADWVAPSDMMDGRVGAIRDALDTAGFINTGIISYCAKYASAFYGPFREALNSAPKTGDKKSYQMNPANRQEALLEMHLDQQEGADILMVKPALSYLDVILKLSESSYQPIAAYQVSGEYAMIEAASANGWLDREQILYETLISIRRAGAQMIFSYHALDYAKILQRS